MLWLLDGFLSVLAVNQSQTLLTMLLWCTRCFDLTMRIIWTELVDWTARRGSVLFASVNLTILAWLVGTFNLPLLLSIVCVACLLRLAVVATILFLTRCSELRRTILLIGNVVIRGDVATIRRQLLQLVRHSLVGLEIDTNVWAPRYYLIEHRL